MAGPGWSRAPRSRVRPPESGGARQLFLPFAPRGIGFSFLLDTDMNPPTSYAVPRPLGLLLSRLPAYPGSVLLASALNVGLADQLQEDVRRLLFGKKLRIHVRDACLTFDFSWTGRGFAACPAGREADLTIAAGAHDFLRLAQRLEDPDTLFFSRRLSMEGDTELGLVVKNTLDALELPVFELQRWAPHRVLERFAPRAQSEGIGPRHHGAGK
jgi:O2-independent ubiquinone biosynthesis accessory factor UbiT